MDYYPPEHYELLQVAARHAVPAPWIEKNDEYYTVFNEMVDKMYLQEVTVEEAMKRVKEVTDPLLR
jgi:hypothetical protein